MKKSLQLFFFLIFLVFLAVAASIGTRFLLPVGCSMCRGAAFMNARGAAEAHHWVHGQLNLTAEQEKAIVPAEEHYAKGMKLYLEEIRLANQELGRMVLEEKGDTTRVQAALARVNEAQKKLQTFTLEHVFSMRETLTPAQYEKLLKLTADALQQMDCNAP